MSRGARIARCDMDAIASLLDRGVEERAFPGGVAVVGRGRGRPCVLAFGRQTYDPRSHPVTGETVYDLASLTKVVATTAVAMRLVDRGALDLDSPVRQYVDAFRGGWREGVSVRHLFSHSSGLPWWGPIYREARGREAVLDRVCRASRAYATGARSAYSDLGFMLLGAVLEHAAGRPLDASFREEVVAPLRLRSTRFRPPRSWRQRVAPTEIDPWRKRLLRGEVHDENASAAGGVAGHAGLFGTAEDLARFARRVLRDGWGGRGRGEWVARDTLRAFARNARVPGSTRGLGWDTTTLWRPRKRRAERTPHYSSAGHRLSVRSFGHTGFTGTSLWIDPGRDLFVGLLTNRVHPSRANDAIRRYRAELADLAVEAHDEARRRTRADVSGESTGRRPPPEGRS